MAKYSLNQLVKKGQIRTLVMVIGIVTIIMAMIIALLSDGRPKKVVARKKDNVDLVGVLNESFTEANSQSALTSQQLELESLKKELGQLTQTIKTLGIEHEKQLAQLSTELQDKVKTQLAANELKAGAQVLTDAGNQLWHNNASMQNAYPAPRSIPKIHTVSFRPRRQISQPTYLNPAHYVPSNTSVRAVILGGADADASVNGQSKNNGVMLFKFLEDGTLPNGQRSRLRGCRVSSNSYGDISSERAYATLYRLSCAHPGQPIIDKEVTGWVFFNGKVGIKGQPLMRDNKIMQWAGISGALSGVASAAQYAQSVQQFGGFGATSVVPSSNIGPYAAYGGASKAAELLSEYYVKRAEQYHPVIQVGSGNVVTVVFKDGFYLEPDEDKHRPVAVNHTRDRHQAPITEQSNAQSEEPTFTVSPEVLGQIDKSYAQQLNAPQE